MNSQFEPIFYTRLATEVTETADDGVTIFCGISLLLAVVATIFSWLGISGPVFY
jgi:hypothetical protein